MIPEDGPAIVEIGKFVLLFEVMRSTGRDIDDVMDALLTVLPHYYEDDITVGSMLNIMADTEQTLAGTS